MEEPRRALEDDEEKLLDRFRDPADPLKILIVTSKLLTGFDAPILQTMYLDKPLRDHTLLQAICRTNRTYPNKTHGLIVDYLGVFDDVAQALDSTRTRSSRSSRTSTSSRTRCPDAVQACLDFFPGVDRTVAGYEGLLAAQDCLPDNDTRDSFAAAYSLPRPALGGALARPGPRAVPRRLPLADPGLRVRPAARRHRASSSGTRSGAKTIELIHENVHVEAIRDDLDTLVLDADLLEDLLSDPQPDKKAKELEIKLIQRLKKHAGDTRFKALGERLEELRERHEQGLLLSLEFLKELAELAKDAVAAGARGRPRGGARPRQGRPDRAVRGHQEREDADHRRARRLRHRRDRREGPLPGVAAHPCGRAEVKQALRQTLLKYKLHQDQELFETAYGYIKQYY